MDRATFIRAENQRHARGGLDPDARWYLCGCGERHADAGESWDHAQQCDAPDIVEEGGAPPAPRAVEPTGVVETRQHTLGAPPAEPPATADHLSPTPLDRLALAIAHAARHDSGALARLLTSTTVDAFDAATIEEAEGLLVALLAAKRRRVAREASRAGRDLVAAVVARIRHLDGPSAPLRLWLAHAWDRHDAHADARHRNASTDIDAHLGELERATVDASTDPDLVERVGIFARRARPETKGRRAGHPSVAIIDWCDARRARLERERAAGADGLAELAALVEPSAAESSGSAAESSRRRAAGQLELFGGLR